MQNAFGSPFTSAVGVSLRENGPSLLSPRLSPSLPTPRHPATPSPSKTATRRRSSRRDRNRTDGAEEMAGDEWRCRRHPPLTFGGVCPHCLRDRLLRLCPDCSCARPCSCASSSSTSSSSSASGSAVGRVCSLIERERRIGRSRSVAASGGGGGGGGTVIGDERRRSSVWGWASFRKPAAGRGLDVDEEDMVALARSSSVSTTAAEAKVAAKAGGWGRFLPGPIKALRHRKSRAGDRRDSVR